MSGEWEPLVFYSLRTQFRHFFWQPQGTETVYQKHRCFDPDLPASSLSFLIFSENKARKTTNKTRIFVSLPNPRNPWKRDGKTLSNNKKQGNPCRIVKKSKEFSKQKTSKERKDRDVCLFLDPFNGGDQHHVRYVVCQA